MTDSVQQIQFLSLFGGVTMLCIGIVALVFAFRVARQKGTLEGYERTVDQQKVEIEALLRRVGEFERLSHHVSELEAKMQKMNERLVEVLTENRELSKKVQEKTDERMNHIAQGLERVEKSSDRLTSVISHQTTVLDSILYRSAQSAAAK